MSKLFTKEFPFPLPEQCIAFDNIPLLFVEEFDSLGECVVVWYDQPHPSIISYLVYPINKLDHERLQRSCSALYSTAKNAKSKYLVSVNIANWGVRSCEKVDNSQIYLDTFLEESYCVA